MPYLYKFCEIHMPYLYKFCEIVCLICCEALTGLHGVTSQVTSIFTRHIQLLFSRRWELGWVVMLYNV